MINYIFFISINFTNNDGFIYAARSYLMTKKKTETRH